MDSKPLVVLLLIGIMILGGCIEEKKSSVTTTLAPTTTTIAIAEARMKEIANTFGAPGVVEDDTFEQMGAQNIAALAAGQSEPWTVEEIDWAWRHINYTISTTSIPITISKERIREIIQKHGENGTVTPETATRMSVEDMLAEVEGDLLPWTVEEVTWALENVDYTLHDNITKEH